MTDVTNFYRRPTSPLNIFLSFLLVVFAFAACYGQSNSTSLTPAAPAVTNAPGIQSYADLVSRVAPAVVTIRSTERSRAPQQFPFTDDPSFRDFFGDRMPQLQQQQPQRVQGVGSGVIV